MVSHLKSLEGVTFISELGWLFDEPVREPGLSADEWLKGEMLRPDLTSVVLKRPWHDQPELLFCLDGIWARLRTLSATNCWITSLSLPKRRLQ